MISKISIVCFASSYAVTLALEMSRLLFRLRVRWLVMISFAMAGLLAHTLYLYHLVQQELATKGSVPFASWYDWALLASWVLAVAYLLMAIRRPVTSVGVFVLPIVLGLIGIAVLMRDSEPFNRQQTLVYWGVVHGLMLLLGTTTVALGFAAGIMYLVQAHRLKKKLPPLQGLRLPSLEWLHQFNRRMLIWSTAWLGIGLLAGIALNIIHHSTGRSALSWLNPTVVTSYLLIGWLVVVNGIELFYKPAREGHKMAYVTLASFLFLVLVLLTVLLTKHGSAAPVQPTATTGQTPIRIDRHA